MQINQTPPPPKQTLAPVRFREVWPSAALLLILGAVFANPERGDWSWLGQFGLWAPILGAALGLALYLFAFWLTLSPRLMTQGMRAIMHNLCTLFSQLSWFQLVVLSILAGVGEEWLMRGVVQSWLLQELGPLLAICLTALLFGLLHFMSITYMVLTFVIGLFFGVVFHFSGSLLLVMMSHTVYDLCAFAIIVKYPHMLKLNLHHAKGMD